MRQRYPRVQSDAQAYVRGAQRNPVAPAAHSTRRQAAARTDCADARNTAPQQAMLRLGSCRESDVMTGGKPCNLCISLNCASIFCKWRMRSECADFDQNAPGYFSFVSVYSTCLRTSGLGSNFISFNLSGLMRLFFVVV